MPSLELLPADGSMLSAWLDSPERLAEVLRVRIPEGWPEFPEAIPYTLAVLQEPESDPTWWMYFFLEPDQQTLVGSGGYKGVPVDGRVEIGYEIAPEFRRQGYATTAIEGLVRQAFDSQLVEMVTAQTLPEPNGSTAVLTKLGFIRTDTTDEVWHWELRRPETR